MDQPLSEHDLGSNVIEKIKDGMSVYDPAGKKIGKVKQVYMGEVDETADELGKGPATAGTPLPNTGNPIMSNLARAFDDDEDKLPEVARAQLLRTGFIRIDTGLFGADHYAGPEQIASVSDGEVRLSVDKDSLIKK